MLWFWQKDEETVVRQSVVKPGMKEDVAKKKIEQAKWVSEMEKKS